MKSKGLIYSGEDIRAMLAGIKTQTRRLTELEGFNANPDTFSSIRIGMPGAKCPWQVGDEIYAKETWKVSFVQHFTRKAWIEYRACGSVIEKAIPDGIPLPNPENKWHSSFVMPRWAARPELMRILKSIRVERVQDINWNDAVAEGISNLFPYFSDLYHPKKQWVGTGEERWYSPNDTFRDIWNSRHAKPKSVRGNSYWANALGWTWAGCKWDEYGQAWMANHLDIVGYISFPFAAEDGDQRDEINYKPHFRCVNPWSWVLGF